MDRAPDVTDADSLALLAGRAYASFLAGDTTVARAVLDRLPSDDAMPARMLLSTALGDVEAALVQVADMQQWYAEEGRTPNVYSRFWFDHSPFFDVVRDRPEFQAILDQAEPYTGPGSEASGAGVAPAAN
jgi:hypothetical protein